jgi:hypothetical protein
VLRMICKGSWMPTTGCWARSRIAGGRAIDAREVWKPRDFTCEQRTYIDGEWKTDSVLVAVFLLVSTYKTNRVQNAQSSFTGIDTVLSSLGVYDCSKMRVIKQFYYLIIIF